MSKIRRLRDYDKLLLEWDYEKNQNIGVDDRVRSSVKYWWKCHGGHSYFTTINKRFSCGTGCPICAGNIVSDGNRFDLMAPVELKGEWSGRNICQMRDVSIGSDVLIWWKCNRCANEWRTGVRNRVALNSGCPKCNKGRQSSRLEIRIFSELSRLMPDTCYRERLEGKEIDIFLRSYGVAIEVDGWRWHKDKKEQDLKKNMFLEHREIRVVRIREVPLVRLGVNDLMIGGNNFREDGHKDVMVRLAKILNQLGIVEMKDYDGFVNLDGYLRYSKGHCLPNAKDSLAQRMPDIASRWHPNRNQPLTPNLVSFSAAKIVWWLCPKGHEWKAKINTLSRVHGKENTGCPYCDGKKVCRENSLVEIYPEIVNIWSCKNILLPNDVTVSSGKRVWWKCSVCGLDRYRRVAEVVRIWIQHKDCRCRVCKIRKRF